MENSIFDSRFEKFFFEEGELDSNFKMIHSDLNNVREKKKNGNFWIVLEACFFNNNDDVGRDFLIFILGQRDIFDIYWYLIFISSLMNEMKKGNGIFDFRS